MIKPTSEVPAVETQSVSAFVSLKEALLAIPEAEVVPLSRPPDEAMELGLKLAASAVRDLARFEQEHPSPPLDEIRSLEVRARAIRGAALLVDSGVEPDEMLARAFLHMARAYDRIRNCAADLYRNDIGSWESDYPAL